MCCFSENTIPGYHRTKTFQVCTLERIPYIFLFNDAIDIYIILTESHDQWHSNKPIYNLRNTLVNEIHVEQSKCPKHLKHFWGHCIDNILARTYNMRHYVLSTCNPLQCLPVDPSTFNPTK